VVGNNESQARVAQPVEQRTRKGIRPSWQGGRQRLDMA
jgi:hypothetical protein